MALGTCGCNASFGGCSGLGGCYDPEDYYYSYVEEEYDEEELEEEEMEDEENE